MSTIIPSSQPTDSSNGDKLDDLSNSEQTLIIVVIVLAIVLVLIIIGIATYCLYKDAMANSNPSVVKKLHQVQTYDYEEDRDMDTGTYDAKNSTTKSADMNSSPKNDGNRQDQTIVTTAEIPQSAVVYVPGTEAALDRHSGSVGVPTLYTPGTAFDVNIIHDIVDVPGITIFNLTGNIGRDISRLFSSKYNLANNKNDKLGLTYKQAVIKDKFFDNRARIDCVDVSGRSGVICNVSELIEYDLIKFDNVWSTMDPQLIGVQLLERNWISLASRDQNKNEKSSKNGHQGVGFTVMQFNMLADALSGGYLDASEETRLNNNIDYKRWFNKCEKSFLNVNQLCLQWNYRGLRIVEEILRCECDIIALQECDQAEWLYNVYLKHYGYKMIKQSNIDSATNKIAKLYLNKDNKIEYQKENARLSSVLKNSFNSNWRLKRAGCVILYKSDKFQVLSETIKVESTRHKQTPDEKKNKKQQAEIVPSKVKSNSSEDEKVDRHKGIKVTIINTDDIIDASTATDVSSEKKDNFLGKRERIVTMNGKTDYNFQEWLDYLHSNQHAKNRAKQSEKLLPTDIHDMSNICCSATFDLIDVTKKIYDKKNGKFLGYGKLEMIDKKGCVKPVSSTFIALNMRHLETKKEFMLVTTHLKSTKNEQGEKARVGQV